MADQLLYDMPTVLDENANPVADGTIEVYEENTTTLVNLIDASGDPLSNPILLDAGGRPATQAFYAGSTPVDVVIKDSAGVQLRQIVGAPRLSAVGAAASKITFAPITGNAATETQTAIANNTADILALQQGGLQADLSGQSGKGLFVNAGETQAAFASVGNIIASYGGTANAITLSTGLSLTSLTPGMRFTAICTAANTGATTLDVDGIGPLPVYAADGTEATALPAGYIRTDVVTRFEVAADGASFVARREIEIISNSNGVAYRHESGLQTNHIIITATLAISTAHFGGFRSVEAQWVYPSAMVSASAFSGNASSSTAFGVTGTSLPPSATRVRFAWTSITSQTSAPREAVLNATGSWY